MIKQTSILAFKQIKPHISYRKRMILNCLRKNKELTAYEISRKLGFSDPNSVRPRINELVKSGEIIELGIKVCGITGKMAHFWGYPPVSHGNSKPFQRGVRI